MASTKYHLLPMDDHKEDTIIDLQSGKSPFDYSSYFTFKDDSQSKSKYKSIFTYTGYNPSTCTEEVAVTVEQSAFNKCCSQFVTVLCYILAFIIIPISWIFIFKKVKQHERYVVYRLGRLKGSKGPGVILTLPCIDHYTKIDLRMKAFSVPPQKIMTSDGALIELGADIYFRVSDAVLSVNGIKDLNHSTRILAQTALHNLYSKKTYSDLEENKGEVISILLPVNCVFGIKPYSDLEENKGEVIGILLGFLNENTKPWGVEISRIELSPVKLLKEPNSLMSGMSNPLNVIGQMLFQSGNMNIPPIPGVHESSVPTVIPAATTQPEAGEVTSVSASPDIIYPHDLLKIVQGLITEELIHNIGAVFKFVITGPGGGVFTLDLKNGVASEGELGETADVTLTLNLADMNAMFHGSLPAFSAYMSGRLSVDGDVRQAMRLSELVDKVKATLALRKAQQSAGIVHV